MMKMKKYRIVGELADNGQSITKFKKEIKKACVVVYLIINEMEE